MSEAMYRNLEGLHVGFISQITGQRGILHEDGTWRKVTAAEVLEKAVTHSRGTYIYRRQETVAEWVALRPILEVYNRETC